MTFLWMSDLWRCPPCLFHIMLTYFLQIPCILLSNFSVLLRRPILIASHVECYAILINPLCAKNTG